MHNILFYITAESWIHHDNSADWCRVYLLLNSSIGVNAPSLSKGGPTAFRVRFQLIGAEWTSWSSSSDAGFYDAAVGSPTNGLHSGHRLSESKFQRRK